MTHLVLDKCINCKYTDCAYVCPVNCFYEGKNMLVINPSECIDCGVCIDECPINAIKADIDLEKNELAKWMEINSKYSQKWSHKKITKIKKPMKEAEKFAKEEKKFEKYFDPNPED